MKGFKKKHNYSTSSLSSLDSAKSGGGGGDKARPKKSGSSSSLSSTSSAPALKGGKGKRASASRGSSSSLSSAASASAAGSKTATPFYQTLTDLLLYCSNILVDSTLSQASARLPPPPKDPLGSTDFLNGSDEAEEEAAPKAAAAASGEEEEPASKELLSSASSGLSEDEAEKNQPSGESGMTLPEFIEHVRSKGRRGLYEEYAEIKNRTPMGTFNHSR